MTLQWIKLASWSIALTWLSLAGCGGSGTATSTAKRSASAPAPGSSSSSAPSDATSAATGDIPDNQAFLTFDDHAAGYSIRYPEGWTRKGTSGQVTFQNRANVIHVVVAGGPAPTAASAEAEVARMRNADPTIKAGAPERLSINGSPVVKISFTRLSPPDPVTAKRLPLTVDRYEYAHTGRTAIVDLGTQIGIDNVDAYRMISRSFRWR